MKATRLKYWMKKCMDIGKENNTPFGAVIVDPDSATFILKANTTREDGKTAHAEMNCLTELHHSGNIDPEKAWLISTGEPCPMCMGATIFCGIRHVAWGLSIKDIQEFFPQIMVDSKTIADASWEKITVIQDVESEGVYRLFEDLS